MEFSFHANHDVFQYIIYHTMVYEIQNGQSNLCSIIEGHHSYVIRKHIYLLELYIVTYGASPACGDNLFSQRYPV